MTPGRSWRKNRTRQESHAAYEPGAVRRPAWGVFGPHKTVLPRVYCQDVERPIKEG